MDIPRFCRENLNPRLAPEDLGDAFQTLVHELLLCDYPDLHLFPGRGKDGAIDLSQTVMASRTVVECKHISESKDGLAEAQRRWHSVASKLETHLADPGGPTKFQAQYGPWYRTDPAIREYLFCVSSKLGNQEQIDQLQDEIAEFFHTLGTKHGHLSHLTELSAEVIDWSCLCNRLKQRPHLIFRWFLPTRPQGLVPLDDSPDRGTFRSYLTSDKLPYYGRGQHLTVMQAPPEVHIPDEEGLLSELDEGGTTGLVVTGSGGIGKTRLTLEIGRLAQRKGWLVLRVQSRLREDALERLVEGITPDTPVLLLVDYIETQRDFGELVETLNDLNDTYSLHLRYVTNCRVSYYQTVAATPRHRQVDLSPVVHDSALNWFERYRKQTVRHILEHSGLEVTDRHLALCRDTPILGVFVSYLHSMGRQSDLAELLNEADFGTWVAKRVQLSFGPTVIHRDLALLIALFPIAATAVSHLDQEKHGALFDTLAADGWIEKLPANESHGVEMWVTAHDVLADQILLSYFKSILPTVERFVHELLSLACKVGCLRAALFTLQRVVDQPQLSSLDWLKILSEEMAEDPTAWREVRDVLIRTSLLTPLQIITLLSEHEEIWEGGETETDFQNALGWLARWSVNQKEPDLDAVHRGVLVSWVQKSAPHAVRSNFILTWGLRLCPEAIREAALQWIRTRPDLFQTHYLLVAWLQCHLPAQDIDLPVRQWLERFHSVLHLSFVVEAWLDAGGERELVRDSIEAWLDEHRTDAEASFVYRGWLDADGEKEVVREPIVAWLDKHETDAEAQFVYRGWLDAGGERELVRDSIEAWLDEHRTDAEASFVYRGWLDAGGEKELVCEPLVVWLDKHGTDAEADFVYKAWLEVGGAFSVVRSPAILWLHQNYEKAEAVYLTKFLAKHPDIPIETVKDILKWCQRFPTDEDALWRLTQLGRHLLKEELGEEVCTTSEAVLQSLMLHGISLSRVTGSQITTLFSYLIAASELRSGQLRGRVDALLLAWLRNPASFGSDPEPHINIQRLSYVQRVVDLVTSGALDVIADRDALERFLRWVDRWEPEWKSRLSRMLDFLKYNYPETEVWDIVQFT